MENKILELYNSFESNIDVGMSKDIQSFFEGREEIEYYNIRIQENIVFIDIKLSEFSVLLAKEVFYSFVKFVSYMKMNIFISNHVDEKIKFLFFTSTDNVNGTKMEILIG